MTMPLEVIIHHLAQAKSALSAARDQDITIRLRSAPGAAGYAGVGYLKALGDAVEHELLIDCRDDAGLVMAALRTGCRNLVFSGDPKDGQRLQQMAESVGARLRRPTDPNSPRLTLSPDDDDKTIRSKLMAAQKR
ncbi:MAG: hypothetical protein ACR2RE_11780 [Geminicoccaceae bacterium]